MFIDLVPTTRAPFLLSASALHPGRNPEFWFSDGNVILDVRSVLFKVHRGQLERQSEIFRDLFTIPQPSDALTLSGCPVVELQDSPSDMAFLLRAMYDGLYFKKPYVEDFASITAVLRLSTKYLIDRLRDRCLQRLELDWPTTLTGWQAREREATDSNGRYNPRLSCPHPILVIAFAREMHLEKLLPSAFYDLCRYGPSKIVAGSPLTKGLRPPVTGVIQDPASVGMVFLSSDDLQKVLIGRECAQRAIIRFIEDHLTARAISVGCHNRDREDGRVCRESFYFIMLNLLRTVGGIASGRDGDPLFTLLQALEMMSRNDFSDGSNNCSLQICASCRLDLTQSIHRAREQIWNEIPKWFGFEPFECADKRISTAQSMKSTLA